MTESAEPQVMIVEDEPRMRELLLRMLHELGYAGRAHASAEAAWRELEASREPTILLLDLNLPGMTGLDLHNKARAAGKPVAAIVLTGFGSVESAQQAIRQEAVDFLTKPCHLGELEAAIVRAEMKLREPAKLPAVMAEASSADSSAHGRTMDQVEHEHIMAALARHGGNRKAAADELGISLRTMYYRLKRYRSDD
jgi:DNA-binding NtrC family response regulator